MPHITVSDERRSPPVQPADARLRRDRHPGLSTPVIRPGIKNPLAITSTLESWLPGTIAPSVGVEGDHPLRRPRHRRQRHRHRSAPRDQGVQARRRRSGRAPSTISTSRRTPSFSATAGDEDRRARRQHRRRWSSGNGQLMSCTVVGLLHTGITQVDETQTYTLLKTAQILAGQTGLVNAIRIKVRDVLDARTIASRVESADRLQGRVLAGGQRGSALGVPDPQFHHVHGRRRDPARRLVRHLQHHLDDHAREDARHRDPEVAWVHARDGAADFPGRGAADRRRRDARRMGARLLHVARPRHGRDSRAPFTDATRLPIYYLAAPLPARGRRRAGGVGDRRLPAGAQGGAACSPSTSSGARHDRARTAARR